MAYNNGFPVSYPYYQQPTTAVPMMMQQPQQVQAQPQLQVPPQQNNVFANNFVWIQGEEGAKAYMVAPGATVLLMDSENSVFYLKSASADGIPQLRIFDYTERTHSKSENNTQDLVKDDGRIEGFEKQISKLESKIADLENQVLDIITMPSVKKKEVIDA